MPKVDGIVIDKYFTSIPNVLLTCNRLKKYQVLLAGMLNLRNMRLERKEAAPNELTISKKGLRSVLGFCSESTIEKQLDELRMLDVVATFSKSGGEDGTFSVTLAENLEDNPYVLMDLVEKQVIKECRISTEKGSKDTLSNLFKLIEQLAESAEVKYVDRMTQDTAVLEEYKAFLKLAIVEAGLGTFGETAKQNTSDQPQNTYPKSGKGFFAASAAKKKAQEMREAVQKEKGLDLDALKRRMEGK